ncbi:MAG: hypothetical protein CTY15_13185 [Methylocystis sp.]|nr:MAG: hypothetical protein CTY15_13185 [Methylocystis sp.]
MKRTGRPSRYPAPAVILSITLALGLSLALAWMICVRTLADMLAAESPLDALFWDPAHPVALGNVATTELERAGNDAERRVNARRAADYAGRLVARDPFASGGLSLFGATQDRLGAKPERVAKIMRVAGKNLPIDIVAHGWLYDYAARTANAADMLTELDILLRGRPSLGPKFVPSVLALLAARPEAEAGLVNLLAASPIWRSPFLFYLCTQPGDSDRLLRIFNRLRQTAAPPAMSEVGPLIDRLLAEQKVDQAYLLWVDSLPAERLTKLGLLYNHDFEYPLTGLPFDWRFVAAKGVAITVEGEEKRRKLNVEFQGGRVQFRNVSHLLVLAPGKYALNGVSQTEGLENARGLRWRLYCVASTTVLAETSVVKGTTAPKRFRNEFVVPDAGCELQNLVLEIPSRIASEEQVSGMASYSDLGIESVAP